MSPFELQGTVSERPLLNEADMKTLIIALNSKYIHSSLAPWYLKAACGRACGEVKVMEFTINEDPDAVLAAIFAENAEIAAFSCYIWNINRILILSENLKKINPGIVTVFGGPEVSYDAEELLRANGNVDYVISGEGEEAFKNLLECLNEKIPDRLQEIKGLSYRCIHGGIKSNSPGLPCGPDSIPSPYSPEMLSAVKDKIAYFEASRGCPFSCSYCLSSVTGGVRFFPTERVKKDLIKLAKAGVRQVKFVDRTFNCHKERAKEIVKFIIDNMGPDIHGTEKSINFHFEAAADLFDRELLDILAKAPGGLIQLEIGIQTSNELSLEAVNRKTDMGRAFGNIRRLIEAGNIHIHLDLIAGLPFEDFESFKNSFNMVYKLRPHSLQLGFLKLLKGSPLRDAAQVHGYVFRSYAPYEILYNNYISYEELTILKGVEELVDRYWNSGRFPYSLEYIVAACFSSPFEFYLSFHRHNLACGRPVRSLAAKDLYAVLLEFAGTVKGIDEARFKECLKLDFLASDSSGHLPAGLERLSREDFKDKCFEFLKDENMLDKYLPEFEGIPAKQIFKKVHFELICIDPDSEAGYAHCTAPKVFLFNYTKKDTVTGRYEYYIVDLFDVQLL